MIWGEDRKIDTRIVMVIAVYESDFKRVMIHMSGVSLSVLETPAQAVRLLHREEMKLANSERLGSYT